MTNLKTNARHARHRAVPTTAYPADAPTRALPVLQRPRTRAALRQARATTADVSVGLVALVVGAGTGLVLLVLLLAFAPGLFMVSL